MPAMAPRHRPLSEQDRALWATYARLVRPFAGRETSVVPPPPKATPAPAPTPPRATLPTSPVPRQLPEQPPRHPLISTGNQPAGLDNATWNKFSSGKLRPVRTIDLHGKTAQAAFHALNRFLHAAQADHLRCVEVITGRGSGEHGGVIRRELPLWLNLPGLRPLILATAHPHALNQGSTRILLRKPR